MVEKVKGNGGAVEDEGVDDAGFPGRSAESGESARLSTRPESRVDKLTDASISPQSSETSQPGIKGRHVGEQRVRLNSNVQQTRLNTPSSALALLLCLSKLFLPSKDTRLVGADNNSRIDSWLSWAQTAASGVAREAKGVAGRAREGDRAAPVVAVAVNEEEEDGDAVRRPRSIGDACGGRRVLILLSVILMSQPRASPSVSQGAEHSSRTRLLRYI